MWGTYWPPWFCLHVSRVSAGGGGLFALTDAKRCRFLIMAKGFENNAWLRCSKSLNHVTRCKKGLTCVTTYSQFLGVQFKCHDQEDHHYRHAEDVRLPAHRCLTDLKADQQNGSLPLISHFSTDRMRDPPQGTSQCKHTHIRPK